MGNQTLHLISASAFRLPGTNDPVLDLTVFLPNEQGRATLLEYIERPLPERNTFRIVVIPMRSSGRVSVNLEHPEPEMIRSEDFSVFVLPTHRKGRFNLSELWISAYAVETFPLNELAELFEYMFRDSKPSLSIELGRAKRTHLVFFNCVHSRKLLPLQIVFLGKRSWRVAPSASAARSRKTAACSGRRLTKLMKQVIDSSQSS